MLNSVHGFSLGEHSFHMLSPGQFRRILRNLETEGAKALISSKSPSKIRGQVLIFPIIFLRGELGLRLNCYMFAQGPKRAAGGYADA